MSTQEVTLPEEIVNRARVAARSQGISLAGYIAQSLEMRVDAERQMDVIVRRACRANVERVIEMVRNAPDLPPDEGDELPLDSQSKGMSR